MLRKELPLRLILFEESPDQLFIMVRYVQEYSIMLQRLEVVRLGLVLTWLLPMVLLFLGLRQLCSSESNFRFYCFIHF